MRRVALSLLALSLGLAPRAAGQSRVSLLVGLSQPGAEGARQAQVQVRDLLADPRWSQALDQSFPIRLTFRLEIWRSREGWIDDFQRQTEWSTVIDYQPLEEQFRVRRIFLSGTEEYRFGSKADVERWIRQINQVEALPQGTGTFYYNVNLRITALSNEDMEELERFLAGQAGAPRPEGGSSIGRSVRRFLLRVAGLPWEELEVRSNKFVVRRRQD